MSENPEKQSSAPDNAERLATVQAARSDRLDASRPEAVAKRRRTGHWTARENLDGFLDPDSFVEYGALARPAVEGMEGPADGLIIGTGAVDGRPCAVMAYDYTVYAGTQSLTNHAKHVFIDLSWVVYPDYVMKELPRWAALIKKFPSNFMIGSDAVGRFGDYPDQIRVFDELFEAIGDRNVVDALAHGNFLRIMPRRGVTLDPLYVYPEDRYIQLVPMVK